MDHDTRIKLGVIRDVATNMIGVLGALETLEDHETSYSLATSEIVQMNLQMFYAQMGLSMDHLMVNLLGIQFNEANAMNWSDIVEYCNDQLGDNDVNPYG